MPAAIAIPLIAGAGATAVGARMQANASRDAARAQSQSADRALALNQRVYDDQLRMVSPFVQFGTQSLANLGRLSATPFSEQTNGFVSAAQGGGIPSFQQGMANPAAGVSLANLPAPQTAPSQPQGGAFGGAVNRVMSGMVQMRGPDGSVRDVPLDKVPMALARGAQRVQ